MGGGIGALILVVVALAAGVSVMLLVLNARWKSAGQILREARENIAGASALVLLALAALLIAAFVVWELLCPAARDVATPSGTSGTCHTR